MEPVGLSFSHVGIFVHDMELMEDFYTRVLEFTVTDRGVSPERTIVFLSRDPREHHQIVLATGRPAELGFNVINQISMRCDSLSTLKDFYQRMLREPAVRSVDSVSHGNALSVYAPDPEGNRLEIFWDLPYYTLQPERIPFDLGREDAVILAEAEAISRSLPQFSTREDWVGRMAARMAQS